MGKQFMRRKGVSLSCFMRLASGLALALLLSGWAAGQSATPAKTPPLLGTLKSISGGTMTVASDTGAETKVTLNEATRLLLVAPGAKDLSQAVAIPITEFQPGDRVLVRLRCAGEPPACQATTVIAMKKSDIAERRAREREEWQRHGIGGLVKIVDASQGTITIGTITAAGKKDVQVVAGKSTIVRRYAPGSVKFDDAKLSGLADIHPGDQLRARGARGADGATFTADEIVTGSFLNIAGTISAVDAGAGTISVSDLVTKTTEVVKVGPETQLRKLPENMAKMIALRLRENVGGEPGGETGHGAPSSAATTTAPESQRRGGGDFQQLLNRLPVAQLGDFQKGEAVMIVATSAESDGLPTAITALGGVEPLLQSSTQEQASSILTPWSLSNGGSEAAAQ